MNSSDCAHHHFSSFLKVDSHQHFWDYRAEDYPWINDAMAPLQRSFGPSDLKAEQQRIDFQGSVAVQARQSLQETRYLLELAHSNDFIKGVVGWVDLQSEKVDEQLQEFVHDKKFVGVRHVLQDEPDDRLMMKPEFLRGIALLKKYGLTYDILIFPRHLPVALELVSKFPEQTFIIDHIAKPFIKDQILCPWREDLRRVAQFQNVYCKLSGMVTEADWKHWEHGHFVEYLDAAYSCFGEDRLMIGSDWPVCLVAGSYPKVMGVVMDWLAKFPLQTQAKILGRNAVAAYNLPLEVQTGNVVM